MSKRSMIFNRFKNHNLHQILRCHDSLNKPSEKLRKKDANSLLV